MIRVWIAGLFCVIGSSSVTAQNSSLLHVSMVQKPAVAPEVMQPELIPPGVPQIFGGGVLRPPQLQPPVPPIVQNLHPPDPVSSLQGVSWMFQPPPPLRSFAIQGIVTIRVDEITRIQAEGEAEKRRISLFQASLADWVRLGTGGLRPDPQVDGDPTVNAQSRSNSVNEATMETRESLTFNIAARIVDIQPNGNLVLEARKVYRINDNLWETSLSGICRAADIGPDNVVLSKDLIDLEIHKEDQGQLRDGVGRGWFQRFFDRVKPF